MQPFAAARWPTYLKVISFLGSAVLLGIGLAAARAIPHGTHVAYAEAVGTFVAFVPPAIAFLAALFVVTGYEIGPGHLRVRRLLWTTPVSLAGLYRIYADPTCMKCSIRIFGNGGLFSFTGIYRNRTFGRYRAFVTDPNRAVALFLPNRVVVVSPADVEGFIRYAAARFKDVRVGP
jgi:Bacterial PH domain